MILIGLLIGCAVFIAVTLLCIMFDDVSSLEWMLIFLCAALGGICGYVASKSKERDQRNKH